MFTVGCWDGTFNLLVLTLLFSSSHFNLLVLTLLFSSSHFNLLVLTLLFSSSHFNLLVLTLLFSSSHFNLLVLTLLFPWFSLSPLTRKYSSGYTRHDSYSYSYTHSTAFGHYAFLALDACPSPGPRRPFNFFGVLHDVRRRTVPHVHARFTMSLFHSWVQYT